MEEESLKLSEWWANMTVGGFATMMLLVTFIILIIVMIARTFKDRSSI